MKNSFYLKRRNTAQYKYVYYVGSVCMSVIIEKPINRQQKYHYVHCT